MPDPINYSVFKDFFTKEHWKHPFSIPETKLPTGESNPKISKTKQGISIAIAIFAGAATGFIAAPVAIPLFFLVSSGMKKWEISQRKRKAANLTEVPGTHQHVPNPISIKNPNTLETPKKVGRKPNTSTQITLLKAPPQLPPPPANGIRVGLTNLANTCWLNSALKYMAASDFWDSILNAPPETIREEHRELQQLLKEFIYNLRTQEGYIGINDCKKLEKKVNKLMQDDPMVGGQMDSPEFFVSLQNALEYPPREVNDPDYQNPEISRHFYKKITIFDNANLLDENYHTPHQGTFESLLKITIPYSKVNSKEPISISSMTYGEERTVHAEFSGKDEPIETSPEGTKYITSSYAINLPEELNVYVDRAVAVTDSEGRYEYVNKRIKQVKCMREVHMDKNGEIPMTEYDPQTASLMDDHTWKIEPRAKYTYELVGAIIHYGGAADGHYVSIQRVSDDQFLYHSDRTVKLISKSKALKACKENGTMLRFKRKNESVDKQQSS